MVSSCVVVIGVCCCVGCVVYVHLLWLLVVFCFFGFLLCCFLCSVGVVVLWVRGVCGVVVSLFVAVVVLVCVARFVLCSMWFALCCFLWYAMLWHVAFSYVLLSVLCVMCCDSLWWRVSL